MRKTLLLALVAYFFICVGCSKDTPTPQVDPDANTPEITLTLVNNTSFSASFDYEFTNGLQNVRLIWSDQNEVDTTNNIGEISITQANSELEVSGLEQSQTYYFQLIGTLEGANYLSDIITVTTSAIEVTFDEQIANSIVSFGISEMLKVNDGFIIVTNPGNIYVSKIDNNFNLQWTTEINERNQDQFKGILDLGNGEFMIFGSGNTNTGLGTFNTKSYAVKINSSGSKLWTKYYHYDDNTEWYFWWNSIQNFKKRGPEIKLLTSVDTIYYNDRSDTFYHEYTLDNDGEIVSQKTLDFEYGHFRGLEYDNAGNLFNSGTKVLDFTPIVVFFSGVVEKYDTDHNLLWSHTYNEQILGDDSLDQLLVEPNYIVNIGKVGQNQQENRIVHYRDPQGNLLWDFAETRQDFLYQGKDILKDIDNNFLVLFGDIFYVNQPIYNLATLIKFDQEGEVVWRFTDGEDFNQDDFVPFKVFQESAGTYSIFGVKEGSMLWVKKIKVD